MQTAEKSIRQQEWHNQEYHPNFWGWLNKNEHIYLEFVSLAKQMQATGRTKWSARGITEVLRWHSGLRSNGDVFKVNNNYSAGMARLAMLEYPVLNGFFELRGRHNGL